MDSPGTPDAAIPLLNNLIAWAGVIALIIVLYVGVRYGMKEGVFAFIGAVVVVGIFSAFAADPGAGFSSAWEFVQTEVLGLDGGGGSPPSGSGSGGG